MKDIGVILGPLRGKTREYEKSAIQIRRFAGLSPFDCLDPFELAASFGMKVVTIKDIEEVPDDLVKTLLIDKSNHWSGASFRLSQNGSTLIILNNSQSIERVNASLMEEICHVLLGHQQVRISMDLLGARDYSQRIESEAYGVGAAVLLPYVGLKRFYHEGLTDLEIAKRYNVSELLVQYRAKLFQC